MAQHQVSKETTVFQQCNLKLLTIRIVAESFPLRATLRILWHPRALGLRAPVVCRDRKGGIVEECINGLARFR